MASDSSLGPEHSARIKLITRDNEYFKEMLDFVPATFYFGGNTSEKLLLHTQSSSETDTKDKAATSSLKRPLEELSLKAKAKRAKYDPDRMKTVTRVQELLLQQEEEAQQKSTKGKHKKKKGKGLDELKSRVENAEDLRERLQAKIELLRAKRQGTSNAAERKRIHRQESKMKLKMRRQEQKKNPINKDGSHKGVLANGGVRPKQVSPPPGKPIYNKEGKMVFSKFDFSESPNKDKKSESSSKNFKKLLEKVEKEKADLKKLKESDLDAAHSVAQKSAWKKALLKAEGVKVKDDPELLKKSIKKQEKKKKKSADDWAERKERVGQKMKEKQDKRLKNIQTKKKAKIDKKIKKAKKKGRIFSGF